MNNEEKKFQDFLHFEKFFEKGKLTLFEAILKEYPNEYRPHIYKILQSTKVFFKTESSILEQCIFKFFETKRKELIKEFLSSYEIENTLENRVILLSLGNSLSDSYWLDVLITNEIHDVVFDLACANNIREVIQLFGYTVSSENISDWLSREDIAFNQERKRYRLEYEQFVYKYSSLIDAYKQIFENREQIKLKYEKIFFSFLEKKHLLNDTDLKHYHDNNYVFKDYDCYYLFFKDSFEKGIFQKVKNSEATDKELMKYNSYFSERNISDAIALEVEEMIKKCRMNYLYEYYKDYPVCRYYEDVFRKNGIMDLEKLSNLFVSTFSVPAGCASIAITELDNEEDRNFKVIHVQNMYLYSEKVSIWLFLIHEYMHAIAHDGWKDLGYVDEAYVQRCALRIWNKVKDTLEDVTGFVDFDKSRCFYEMLFPYMKDILNDSSNGLKEMYIRTTPEVFMKSYDEEVMKQYFSFLNSILRQAEKNGIDSLKEESLDIAKEYMNNYNKR